MPRPRKRQAIYLPNGGILIPVDKDEAEDGWAEIGSKHPDYQRWLRVAGKGEDPRPRKEK
jgi:hypothetical protein